MGDRAAKDSAGPRQEARMFPPTPFLVDFIRGSAFLKIVFENASVHESRSQES